MSTLTAVGIFTSHICALQAFQAIYHQHHRATLLMVNYGYYENREKSRSVFSDNLMEWIVTWPWLKVTPIPEWVSTETLTSWQRCFRMLMSFTDVEDMLSVTWWRWVTQNISENTAAKEKKGKKVQCAGRKTQERWREQERGRWERENVDMCELLVRKKPLSRS